MNLIAQRQFDHCGDEYLRQEDDCPIAVLHTGLNWFMVYRPGAEDGRIIHEDRVELTGTGLRIWAGDEFFFVDIGQLAALQAFSAMNTVLGGT